PARAAIAAARDRDQVRRWTALVVLSAAAVLSIWYYPDTIHIAFIAGGFWLCAAVGAEWLLAYVRPAVLARVSAAVLVAAIRLRLGRHLVTYARPLPWQFSVSR